MKTLNRLIALVVACSSTVQGFTPASCPTVTSTGSVCSTYPVLACAQMSTISSVCGCPKSVPTTTIDFPCGGPKPSGCQKFYSYETSVPSCGGVSFLTQTIPTRTDPPELPTVCPTVTETGTVCGSCIRPMCFALSTIYNLCNCPASVPTVSASYPCGGGCPGGCAGTSYVYASNTPSCTSTA